MTTANWGSPAASRPVLPARSTALFLFLVSLLATVPAIGLALTAGAGAESRGTPMNPGSRTLSCHGEGAESLWSGATTYGATTCGAGDITVVLRTVDHNGSLNPAERAVSDHVVSGHGGDGATSPPCRAG